MTKRLLATFASFAVSSSFMKRFAGLVLLAFTVITVLFLIFGDESYSNLRALERSVKLQTERNANLDTYVSDLKSTVRSLRYDDRAIEIAARNELGMARPDEIIFFFEEKKVAKSSPAIEK